MNLCLAVAKSAETDPLPLRFAGNQGLRFVDLVRSALKEKGNKARLSRKRNINLGRLTSYELWNSVLEFKGEDEMAAFFFENYKEVEFRFLTTEWLNVLVTHKSLSKQFSTFMTKTCCDHLNKYKIVGLTPNNAEEWFGQLLEDRTFCPIHIFEFARENFFDLKLS